MSDDEKDIDIETDDDDSETGPTPQRLSTQSFTREEKRAHHNALERKRRDHIKESFTSLREAVPSLKGEKASRAQILKKTTEYLQNMKRKITVNKKDICELRHQINVLDEEIRLLELAKNGHDIDPSCYQQLTNIEYVVQQDESSCGNVTEIDIENTEDEEECNRSKKMKTSYHQV